MELYISIARNCYDFYSYNLCNLELLCFLCRFCFTSVNIYAICSDDVKNLFETITCSVSMYDLVGVI